MMRGKIWWAELPAPAGSEPGYRRAVVIMQSDNFTRSRISTVVVVIITSNTALANAPGNVFLPKTHTQLPQDSVANVSQILTVDKAFLSQCVSSLSPRYIQRIEEGMRLVLSL